jgi:hypothetical protein
MGYGPPPKIRTHHSEKLSGEAGVILSREGEGEHHIFG